MKTVSIILFAMLCSGAASAHPHTLCSSEAGGNCPVPPMPPMPPMPPIPPMPPMPPPPPPMPAIPAAAHAACAGKAHNSSLRYVIKKGETMGGTCVKTATGMDFKLHYYNVEG